MYTVVCGHTYIYSSITHLRKPQTVCAVCGFRRCVILLYMYVCPHTTVYMCPHTAVYICPHTDSTHCLRLLQERHTAIHVSAYCIYVYIRVRILLYTSPLTDGTHHCGCCVPFFPFVFFLFPLFFPQRALLSCISSLNQQQPPPTANIPRLSTVAWSPRR
jgi:hypothetical protein